MSAFPGDALLADPLVVVDRHATFAAPVAEVWPWVVQIGKGRGGWYLGRFGVRRIIPEFQHVFVGMEEADWGPGGGIFRCMEIVEGERIVWWQRRGEVELTWVLMLSTDAAGGTHLHVRLRMHKEAWRGTLRFRVLHPLMDLFDWVTVVLLFRGLRLRVDGAG